MTIENLGYRPYRPSGYTDDLGIMADRNQWVPAQLPGWYVRVPITSKMDVRAWLDDNSIDYTDQDWSVVIHDRDHATLFKMRWL